MVLKICIYLYFYCIEWFSVRSKIGVDAIVNVVERDIKRTLGSSSNSGEDITNQYIDAIKKEVNVLFEELSIVNTVTVSAVVVDSIIAVSNL